MQKKSSFADYTLGKWMKFSINSLAFLLLAPALVWGTTTIVITNPSPSLTVPTQFGVAAYAYGNDQIHVLQIYLDQVGKVYELVNPPRNRINTLITAGAGTRLITVQAMDDSGHVLGLSQFSFNVTSTPVELTGLDHLVNAWLPCQPAKGCNSGGNNTPTPSLIGSDSPNWNGDNLVAEFQSQNYDHPPAPAYDTAFWWLPHPAPSSEAHYFRYDFDLYIESTYENVPQALEWEVQQTINGSVYNMAWQANYAGDGSTECGAAAPPNVWRVFNYSRKCWEQVDLQFTRFNGNTWYHVSQENHIDSHGVVWHDALTITNNSTGASSRLDPSNFNPDLNAWQSISHVPPLYSGRGNEFHNAVQLDIDQSGSVYRIFVDQMSVTYVP